jgi:hypothetical protein
MSFGESYVWKLLTKSSAGLPFEFQSRFVSAFATPAFTKNKRGSVSYKE